MKSNTWPLAARLLVAFVLCFTCLAAGAQTVVGNGTGVRRGADERLATDDAAAAEREVLSDTLRTAIYFHQGYSLLDTALRDNGQSLRRFVSRCRAVLDDPDRGIRAVRIVAGASPEGTPLFNQRLSERRAATLRGYLVGRLPELDSLITIDARGEDYLGLTLLVEADRNVPYRDEVLSILRERQEPVAPGRRDARKSRLIGLRGGEPWRYMYRNLFPTLRSAGNSTVCEIEVLRRPVVTPDTVPDTVPEPPEPEAVDTAAVAVAPRERRDLFVSVSTNGLYDLALVPNIGVEVSLGRRWSVAGHWMYAWWKTDKKHDYWRVYGGDLGVRRYFGAASERKPLTGHHVGLYGQIITYDFELGHRGYLAPKWSWAAGVEYGVAMPIGRRLNIDLSVGLGYLHGKYYEYLPIDQCYVWQATKKRHWWGPTKVEASLVWLLGHGNENKKKGGER